VWWAISPTRSGESCPLSQALFQQRELTLLPPLFSSLFLPFMTRNCSPSLAGTFIGALVAATAIVGYVGGAAPVRRKRFLLAFAWLIVAALFAELLLGGVIWFKTLRMRSLFASQWLTWSDELKIAFQQMVRGRRKGGRRRKDFYSPRRALFLCVCVLSYSTPSFYQCS